MILQADIATGCCSCIFLTRLMETITAAVYVVWAGQSTPQLVVNDRPMLTLSDPALLIIGPSILWLAGVRD